VTVLWIVLFATLFVLAYLFGSIPFGLLVGRLFFGIDIREHGSGNVGTTNVFRVLGKRAGIAVFAFDLLKGFVPALVASLLFEPWPTIFVAAAPVVGHMYSPFLKGRGGKGVATGAGVVLALAPVVFLTILAAWVVLVLVTRYVSLASIVAAVSLPVLVILGDDPVPYQIAAVLVAAIVVFAHRGNIERLLHGTEPRVRLPWGRPPLANGPGGGAAR
jgi:glycerol-3-phosphate acyltransferase PlsY